MYRRMYKRFSDWLPKRAVRSEPEPSLGRGYGGSTVRRPSGVDGVNNEEGLVDGNLPRRKQEILDLRGHNFSGYDLTDVDLEGALCSGCSFRYSIVAWGNLRNADLTNADFAGAILCEVDFRGANLTGADFTNACLLPVYASAEQFLNCTGLESASVDICPGFDDSSRARG